MDNYEEGFTLLELLVAIFIFSLIASLGIQMLSGAVTNKSVVQEKSDKIKQIQLAHAQMQSDFLQVANKSSKDSGGYFRIPAFSGGDQSTAIDQVEVIHKGWKNPGGMEARSNLQRVKYYLDEGNLYREVYLRVNPSQLTPTRREILVSDVEGIDFLFLLGDQKMNVWNPVSNFNSGLPSAVEVAMEISGFGRLRQVFQVTGRPFT